MHACAYSARAARVRVHLLALLRATALACTTARLQRARRVRSRVGVPEWAVHCLRSRVLARLVVASPHALTTRALRALRARTWREYVVRARRLARGIRALDEARELHHKKSLVFLITYWLDLRASRNQARHPQSTRSFPLGQVRAYASVFERYI